MDTRIDFYPTHEHAGHKLRAGKHFPFGATLVPGGVNFSVFSRHATACTLVLYRKHESTPMVEIPFPDVFRIGNTWAMVVFDVDYEGIEYGYRMEGPWDPAAGHRFDSAKVLLDPYAKAVGGRDMWGKPPDWNEGFPHRGRLVFEDFDWEDDRPLETPIEDLVIYEMHVRSFTADPSSGVKFPGTFAGLMEKIDYVKSLGINCVEFMPVFEFDEFENSRTVNGETLFNYWGYSTVNFFAPKAGFAATGAVGMQIFSQFVQTLKLLEVEMKKAGLTYSYLDGKTKKRQDVVDDFQNDPLVSFFLISLKAGGVGLNLTAADYVIHLDPWWNPAVEIQAADRAHRIGQDKPVFIYKYIARETVEEKILELQNRKKELVEQLISSEGSFFKSLTSDDVKVLFS